MKQTQLALELYFDKHGSFPVQELGSIPSVLEGEGVLAHTPHDPALDDKSPYLYVGTRDDFCVGSALENDFHALNTCDGVEMGNVIYNYTIGPIEGGPLGEFYGI